MPNSKHIAGLVRPILIVMTISEALNSRIWIAFQQHKLIWRVPSGFWLDLRSATSQP
jgi:hypothetical protein